MSLKEIRKDVKKIRAEKQSFLIEPDWLIQSRKINKSLNELKRLYAILSKEEVNQVRNNVVKNYKKTHDAGEFKRRV